MTALPALPDEPSDVEDAPNSDALQQQFYSAVMAANSSGSQDLDMLLRKGLYGKHMPKPLRGQKAADAFQSAFDLIGGIPRLALWADKNPTAFFSLYSKLIPSSIQANVNATIKIDAPWMNPNRLAYQSANPQEVVDVTPSDPSSKSS